MKALGRLFGLVLGLVLWSLSAQAGTAKCRVFLVPGAFGPGSGGGAAFFVSSEEYFAEYRAFFETKGCAVKIGVFPPDATIEERAMVFRDQLARFVKEQGGAAWVVAHSQGALDARFALQTLKAQGVSALVSVGAPHQGTPLADWVVDHRDRGSWLYWSLRWFADYDLRALRFAAELSPAFLKKHEARFATVSGVRYAAARALCRRDCSRLIGLLASWAGVPEGDGIVPAGSQAFGDDLGEYDLDHLSEIAVNETKRGERARLLGRVWEFLNVTGRSDSGRGRQDFDSELPPKFRN